MTMQQAIDYALAEPSSVELLLPREEAAYVAPLHFFLGSLSAFFPAVPRDLSTLMGEDSKKWL